MFRSLVGALQYLTFTRPYIAFAVNYACQFMASCTNIHFSLVKRILRYLEGTITCGFTYSANSPLEITTFSGADWALDINTRWSTIGYVVFLGQNPILWQSKKQGGVSRSSTEVEYKALANAATDMAWVRLILKDLHVFLHSPPLLHCDNISTLALCSNPIFHTQIKQLDTDFHFVREIVQKGNLQVEYISTIDQWLTFWKRVYMFLHSFITFTISSWDSSVEIEGEGINHVKWQVAWFLLNHVY